MSSHRSDLREKDIYQLLYLINFLYVGLCWATVGRGSITRFFNANTFFRQTAPLKALLYFTYFHAAVKVSSFLPFSATTQQLFFHGGIQWRRFPPLWSTNVKWSQDVRQLFFCLSSNVVVFLPLYPIPQKNLLWCTPPCRRFCSIVEYNREKCRIIFVNF